MRTSSVTSHGEGQAQPSVAEGIPANGRELAGGRLQCNTIASSVEGAPGEFRALVWCCLGEGSSVTQAVKVEVVVCGWPDQGLHAAVGLTLDGRAVGTGEAALGVQSRRHSPSCCHLTLPQACHVLCKCPYYSRKPHTHTSASGADRVPVLTSSATRKW